MELAPFFRYGLPVIIVFVIGLLGRTRRVGFAGAIILSIVLTPIGGFLVTVLSGPKPIEKPKTRSKTNPAPAPIKKRGWFARMRRGSEDVPQPQL
jgi:hypothetical protein